MWAGQSSLAHRVTFWKGRILSLTLAAVSSTKLKVWRLHTDIKNTLLDSMGEGEGGMIWEKSTEMCISPYVKQITSPTGHSKHWDNPEGWDGKGGGRGVQDGRHVYTLG